MSERDDYADHDLPPPSGWAWDIAPFVYVLVAFAVMAGATLLLGLFWVGRPH